jgi:hypothetical protein
LIAVDTCPACVERTFVVRRVFTGAPNVRFFRIGPTTMLSARAEVRCVDSAAIR